MPNRDGTGPNGQGPATGRGAGRCQCGCMPAHGCHGGRGSAWTTKDNKTALVNERDYLKERLTAIEADLKSSEEKK